VKYITDSDYAEFSRRVVPEVGDVLYTKGGTTGIARAVDLTFPFQVWVHIAVLKIIKSKIKSEFLAVSLNSPRCYEQAQLFTRGATNQDLGLGRMKDIFLGLPPISVQSEILSFLSSATQAVTAAIRRASDEIILLQEFRTRLIADVATGKLDVRVLCAGLPEVTDIAPIDELMDGENLDETIDDFENEEVAI
jgi:type I restriction enzyme, S subunit